MRPLILAVGMSAFLAVSGCAPTSRSSRLTSEPLADPTTWSDPPPVRAARAPAPARGSRAGPIDRPGGDDSIERILRAAPRYPNEAATPEEKPLVVAAVMRGGPRPPPPTVPEGDLAAMRGRFLDGTQVVYFSLRVFSSWRTVDSHLEAGLRLSTNISSPNNPVGANPSVEFVHSAGVPPPETPPDHLTPTVEAGGLERVAGSVQGIIVESDFNVVRQNLTINVVSSEQGRTDGFGFGGDVVRQQITETTTTGLSNETLATAFIEQNAVGLVIDRNSTDRLLQEVRGGAIGHAAQFTRLNSHANTITNQMIIDVGTRSTGVHNLRSATMLHLTKGLRP